MSRLAVYYIPPAHSPFYRLGTSILGYDIRREQSNYPHNPIRAQIPDFEEAFVRLPQAHGLHCTIVAPQAYKAENLAQIQAEIELILNSFAPTTNFIMQAQAELIKFWGKKQEIVVLEYAANPAFLILHSLLVARLAPYALPEKQCGKIEPVHHAHRSKNFHYPFLFDDYTPHFTLLYPYTGHAHHEVYNILHGIFRGFSEQKLESICLIVQEQAGENWRIEREFHRADYPQSFVE